MSTDFNNDFKGFVDESKCFKEVMELFNRDDSYRHGSAQYKGLCEKTARASFESLVIYRDLIPAQALALLREPITELIHQFHSEESKAFMKGLKSEAGLSVRTAHTLTQLAMQRGSNPERLLEEVNQWKARLEADAPDAARAAPSRGAKP